MTLSVVNYQTVTPTRVVDEANNTRAPIASIDVHVFLDAPEPVMGERGKRWTQNGRVRVREGPDLKGGDEITLAEGVFGVVGGPTQSRRNSLTGNGFGWVRYNIRRGG